MANKLITEDKVSVIFGCWTSACRKTVKPVVEKYNHLLVYPLQYEGLEQSPNIIYTGSTPNQQIFPAIKWAFKNLGTRFFLVGSDYVFPHAANELIKHEVLALGGEIVGEEYLTLGSNKIEPIIQKIITSNPSIIINTLNGNSNIPFFQALRTMGITPKKAPTLSFSIAEVELQYLDASQMAGDYAAWSYFQSMPKSDNQLFVSNFKNKYGEHRVTDDPMESAYFSVFLWAQAVKDAGTDEVTQVREHIKSQIFKAPEGQIQVDQKNHVWKKLLIGKIRHDGQFDIVWNSNLSIPPIAYPTYRTPKEWDQFLENLYMQWGNNWSNPGMVPVSVPPRIKHSSYHRNNTLSFFSWEMFKL
jgi:urea transport system substrate-binding protein